MGKGLPATARKSNARMPYGLPSSEAKRVPRDWKRKQQAYTAAGLRRLGAPWVRALTKSSESNMFSQQCAESQLNIGSTSKLVQHVSCLPHNRFQSKRNIIAIQLVINTWFLNKEIRQQGSFNMEHDLFWLELTFVPVIVTPPIQTTCSHPCKVVMALCTAIFSCPGLDWSNPTDSLELFAGDCSITKGELADRVCQKIDLTRIVLGLPFWGFKQGVGA